MGVFGKNRAKKLTLKPAETQGVVNPFTENSSGDENTERGNWSGKFDFFLSCLGYAVGLGNVWRFPYLCYENGGGAFFIPYVIMLMFVGMPIFFLELSLGQFVSRGPIKCWGFARLFSGLGVAMISISFLVAIYYNMILAWAIFYFFASFNSKLPWEECDPEWASTYCRTNLNNELAANCTPLGFHADANGVCYNVTGAVNYTTTAVTGAGNTTTAVNETRSVVGLWNKTLAKENDIQEVFPASDYLYNYVLKQSEGFEDFGLPDWRLLLCLLLAWVIIFLCLIKGIKSSGKVVYFTATFPYIVLVILFVRGLFLEGFAEGIKFYITPDLTKLADSKVWKAAATQIFFSLSTSWGGLIALASYNKFSNNQLRDTIVVSLGNCLTSVFAGFVIFSYLGFLAHSLGTEVSHVAKDGVGLAFTVYPDAVTHMSPAPLWSILFFLMLIILGLDSQFVLVETVLTSILDYWPSLRPKKSQVLAVLCSVLFVLGLCLTCPGGPHMLKLLDTYSGGWNVLVIAILECVAITYFYGFRRFREDIRAMIGDNFLCIPWTVCSYWWAATWGFITPALVMFVLIYDWINWGPTTSGGKEFPVWADGLGMVLTAGIVLSIFVIMVVKVCLEPGASVSERLRKLALEPEREWGPALVKDRMKITHVRNFDIDPFGELDNTIELGSKPSSPISPVPTSPAALSLRS